MRSGTEKSSDCEVNFLLDFGFCRYCFLHSNLSPILIQSLLLRHQIVAFSWPTKGSGFVLPPIAITIFFNHLAVHGYQPEE